MKNLTPHGHPKTIAKKVNRELTQEEIKHLKSYHTSPQDVQKIYESEGFTNWNLMLLKKGYFLSVPRYINDGCKPASFGNIDHVNKYYILIE